MTKVLLWHWGRRGGGPRYTYELAKALTNRSDLGVELSLSKQCEIGDAFRATDWDVFFVDTYSGKLSAAGALLRLPNVRRHFYKWLSDRRFDVVICTMSHLWDVAMLGAIKRSGARFLLVVHDAVPHPGERYLLRQALLAREIKAADAIVALTDSVRELVCKVHQYPVERTRVIPHGAFAYFRATEARAFPAARPFHLLFFGRLLPYKGLPMLLIAYRELVKTYPNVALTIAGPGDYSPYRRLTQDLPNVRIDNRWIPEEEIGAFFERSDLVVAPYIEASQSGVVVTAYAAALPVLATPVGGLSEQVRHEQTGLVADVVSSQALLNGITRFIQDSALYERCSEGALREAETRLAWPAIAENFARVIQEVSQMPRFNGLR